MADNRRFFPNQQLDLAHILQEAQQRWLRPTEICEILRNYQKFQLTPDPPVKPAAGSLFLFDRKALRYFRKDGHRWRKKKDGKTVREAHEKLKAGSVDVLHCYYAHGEDNENFQRRSYWMLDGQLEHIVLVHYREVKEGYKSGISRVQNADPCSQIESPQGSSAPFLAQGNSPAPTVQTSYGSSPNTVDWSGQTVSSEFDDGDSGEDPGTSSLTQPLYGSVGRKISLLGSEAAGSSELSKNHLGSEFAAASSYHGTEPSLWGAIHNSSRDVHSAHDQKYYFEQPSGADLMTHKLIDARLDTGNALQDVALGDRMIPYIDNGELKLNSERVFQWPQGHDFNLVQPQLHSSFRPQTVVTSATLVNPSSREVGSNNVELGELKKLDSFGRWMDKEIGRDCDDSLMASDSGNYWNTLDAQNDDKEVSSLSRHMQLDIGSLGPSLSQEQLFSISDFSPDWAYSGVETKVLIIGTFLGDAKRYTSCKWSCMFGEIEVSAEVLTENVIRCRAPLHVTGRVPFYVTCSNRLACSEVREFEYRENPMGVAFSLSVKCAPEDEMRFQIRLAKMLCSGFERKWMDCSIQDCDKCKLKKDIYLIKREHETDLEKIEDDSGGNYTKAKDLLIQNLLKDRLCEWLVCKIHEGGKGAHILDDQGQGPIHLAAALGYEWAMGPIVAAGVSPSFRDARGRTGLHWASYFGREATVITLVRLGAAPGAVEDPTPAFPGGQTAADLASSRGYKGIAGYLAEADLTSHLSLLTVCGNVKDNFAANIAAEKAIENAAQTAFLSDKATEEELSLKGSLAAVRNSARAAALIQAAFRANSFRHRQSTKANDDISEVPLDLVALGSLSKVQKMGHFQDYLHSAAVRIQQKYRGWKGRKEFLKIRSRIVKIQAHVRGHQVRKQYKKVVWSVSIVEKAVLRWRRKRPGLRGFRSNLTIENGVSEAEKSDEYEFLRIGRKQKFAGVEKALARVQSMVRHPEAREQYMRMVAKFDKVKMGDEGSSASQD